MKRITVFLICLGLIGTGFIPQIGSNDSNGYGNRNSLTFYPTDDTYISRRTSDQNMNFNDRDFMEVENLYGASGEWGEHSLIKFDISSIPSNSKILSAHLYLFYHEYQTNNPDERMINLSRITSDWDEETVTWNNQPIYESIPTTTEIIPSIIRVWISWDVTNDVQGFVNGDIDKYGIPHQFDTI